MRCRAAATGRTPGTSCVTATSGAATWRADGWASTGSSRAPSARRTRSLCGPLATGAACGQEMPPRTPSAGGRRPAISCASWASTTRRRSRRRGRTATGRHPRESTGRATARSADRTARRTRTPGPMHPSPGRPADRKGARRGRASARAVVHAALDGERRGRAGDGGTAGPLGRSREPPVGFRLGHAAPPGIERPRRAYRAHREERARLQWRSPAERERELQRLSAPQRGRELQPVAAPQRGRGLPRLSVAQRWRQLRALPAAGRTQRAASLAERRRRLAGPSVGRRLERVALRQPLERTPPRQPGVVPPPGWQPGGQPVIIVPNGAPPGWAARACARRAPCRPPAP